METAEADVTKTTETTCSDLEDLDSESEDSDSESEGLDTVYTDAHSKLNIVGVEKKCLKLYRESLLKSAYKTGFAARRNVIENYTVEDEQWLKSYDCQEIFHDDSGWGHRTEEYIATLVFDLDTDFLYKGVIIDIYHGGSCSYCDEVMALESGKEEKRYTRSRIRGLKFRTFEAITRPKLTSRTRAVL